MAQKSHRFRRSAFPYILIAPLMLLIVGLALTPTVLTFVDSFFHINPLNPPDRFIGVGNYSKLFQNQQVLSSWENTLIYMLIGVILTTAIGFGFALALWRNFRGRSLLLAFLILPWALPTVIEGIIWNWIYNPNYGLLNTIFYSLHLIAHYQVWLSTNRLLTVLLIDLVQIWHSVPLSTLLILASLETIPIELYDAAAVDGSGRWDKFWHITLPLVRTGLAIAIVQALIQSLNIYDPVYVLNGTATIGSSIMLQTYLLTFVNLNFGQGYALSFLVTIVTLLLSAGVLRSLYSRVEYT